ncbi:MAG: alpha/beta fold hydrolase [Chthoniobacterales bacterium]
MAPAEETFSSWDGAELFYRAWLPGTACDRALLFFHRGHEHSGRWQNVVKSLGLNDVAIFAPDARGHGHSGGERGCAENFAACVKDVGAFVRHVSAQHGIALEQMILIGHSVGAVAVAAWVHDYAPQIRAMILATAALRVRLYVPLAVPALRAKQKVSRGGFVTSYVRSKMLTRDAAEAAAYDADPLIFRKIAINVLLDLHDAGARLIADAGAIHVPTLMLGAGRDWVVSLAAQRQFFNGLSSAVKQMHVFPAAQHAIFHDQQREQVIDRMREFVVERWAAPLAVPSLTDADRSGPTWEEHERLKLRGGMHFPLIRAGLQTAGRLSRGINVGCRAGFDSGTSLDYVYENKPRGVTMVGRAIDAAYLNSPGWRGIRQRRENLQRALRRVIESTHGSGRPVNIFDVAAGPGRYVIETLAALREVPVTAVLRDCKVENVEAARCLAGEVDLTNVRVEQADAFDRATYSIDPRATIGIVSGLYELFPSNAVVAESLAGFADAIVPGGHLIYTNQPWHPQLEFIARVLRNREGQPWVMRRRTTAEIDQLVARAGFEKIEMEIDEWGMFSVSIARRLG